MLTTELLPNRIELRAFGTLTVGDFKAFEEEIQYRTKLSGPVDVLLDLRNMLSCSIDAALEEFRYARLHTMDFRRVAVLTADQVVSWSTWLAQFFVDANIRIFSDEDDARAWLAGVPDPASRGDSPLMH